MADGEGVVAVRGVPGPGLGHRRHDLSRQQAAADDLVPGDVAGDQSEERHERAGQSHLNLGFQDVEQVFFVPTGFEAFGLDADLDRLVVLQQVQGDSPQQ